MIERNVFAENLIGYFEEQTKKDCSVSHIIHVLGTMNSMALLMEDNERDKQRLIDFSDYFLKRFGVSDAVMSAIHETWLNLPGVLRKGLEYQEEFALLDLKPYYDRLTSKERKKADSLADFLMDQPVWRQLLFYFADGSKNSVALEGAPGKKEREYSRNIVRLNLAKLLYINGVLLAFLSGSGTETKMYGLNMSEGEIRNILPMHLQRFLEGEPDHSLILDTFHYDFNQDLRHPVRRLEKPSDEEDRDSGPSQRKHSGWEKEENTPGYTEQPAEEKPEKASPQKRDRIREARIIRLPFGERE